MSSGGPKLRALTLNLGRGSGMGQGPTHTHNLLHTFHIDKTWFESALPLLLIFHLELPVCDQNLSLVVKDEIYTLKRESRLSDFRRMPQHIPKASNLWLVLDNFERMIREV